MRVEQLRALRTASQRLDRPAHGSVGKLVRALGGVQAQVLGSAELALRARAKGLTREDVTAARERDRSVVWCWAMRGTMHLVAAEDVGWMLPLFAPLVWPNSKRRLKQLGVRDDHVDLAVEQIERELRDDGPLPRRELASRLAKKGIQTQGQAIAHLVAVAALRGRICFGPLRGAVDGDAPDTRVNPPRESAEGDAQKGHARENPMTFVALADWLPGFKLREPDAPELARRFLSAYGPAGPADLAAWSGLGTAAAREAFGAISAELVEEGDLWSLRKVREADPGVVRLLPAFDPYLLGYADRSFALSAAHAKQVNAGGGWLHPQLFVDGEIAGTWTPSGALKPFRPPPAAVRKALEADLEELERWRAPTSDGVSAAAGRVRRRRA